MSRGEKEQTRGKKNKLKECYDCVKSVRTQWACVVHITSIGHWAYYLRPCFPAFILTSNGRLLNIHESSSTLDTFWTFIWRFSKHNQYFHMQNLINTFMLYFNATLVHYKYNRNWASSISTEECSKSLIRFLKKQKFEKNRGDRHDQEQLFPTFLQTYEFFNVAGWFKNFYVSVRETDLAISYEKETMYQNSLTIQFRRQVFFNPRYKLVSYRYKT